MNSKAMVKAVRAAQGHPDGPEILGALREEPARQNMLAAAARGLPPISAVGDMLERRFSAALTSPSARQFIGVCIAGIMAEAGYEVAQTRARAIGAGPFKTGATYRRISERAADERPTDRDDALERMIAALTYSQARRALAALQVNFRELFNDAD